MLYVGHGMWVLMSCMVHAIAFVNKTIQGCYQWLAMYTKVHGWIGIKF